MAAQLGGQEPKAQDEGARQGLEELLRGGQMLDVWGLIGGPGGDAANLPCCWTAGAARAIRSPTRGTWAARYDASFGPRRVGSSTAPLSRWVRD